MVPEHIKLLRKAIRYRMNDELSFRMKYVGGKVRKSKLSEFRFKGPSGISKELNVCKMKIYTREEEVDFLLFISNSGEVINLRCCSKSERFFEGPDLRSYKSYGSFKKELDSILSDLIDTKPISSMEQDWFHATEHYTLEDAKNQAFHLLQQKITASLIESGHYTKEEAEEAKKTYNSEKSCRKTYKCLDDGMELDLLHQQAIILSHTVNCINANDEKFEEHFSYGGNDLWSARLLTAVLRHIEKYPCLNCLVEFTEFLLWPYGLINTFSDSDLLYQSEISTLLRHILKYHERLTDRHWFLLSSIYSNLNELEACIQCLYQIKDIPPESLAYHINCYADIYFYEIGEPSSAYETKEFMDKLYKTAPVLNMKKDIKPLISSEVIRLKEHVKAYREKKKTDVK